MSLPKTPDTLKSDTPGLNTTASTPPAREQIAVKKITPHAFYEGTAVNYPSAVQSIVTTGYDGKTPNDHAWCRQKDWAAFAAEKAHGCKPAYLSGGAFDPTKVSTFSGRKQAFVLFLRTFWLDVEGSAEKFNKLGGEAGGYPNASEANKAVGAFSNITGLKPNFLVATGSGGVHVYYVLDEPITLTEWLPLAKALVALARQHGFKIDAQCTADAARIMRAPGSIHQKTGTEVVAYRVREETYTLAQLSALVGHVPGAVPAEIPVPASDGFDLGINSDVLGDYPKFSYLEAAKQCQAMNQAMTRQGRDTAYPVWILAVRAADLSIEGRALAHQLSEGHEKYEFGLTERVAESMTGGPASCLAWENAYGPGGPCETCAFRSAK